MEDKEKIKKCKYSHPHFKNNSIEYHCIVDGWEDDKVRICKKEECESCQKFKSKYIEYPITVHEKYMVCEIVAITKSHGGEINAM